ncbi:hypothetical protein GCM10028806_33310 [Spirosoma terrae]|uniref:HAD family hydrolase n=1 Tax=Spirosoma terrae TaxID=1968276 RepID=A0A6L9L4Y2_9BACT|nr:hypothetical protein [Spirosoma terrae]NDU95646.1 hypothetical protein [Spirosoma terrae]
MFTIAVDFDGTIAYHDWGKTPQFVPGALETLTLWNQQPNIQLVLNTMRSGKYLEEAIWFLETHGIKFVGYNQNPTQQKWTSSPKVYANLYIDDASLGCPVTKPDIFTPGGRPYVDWAKVDQLVSEMVLFVEPIHQD